MEGIYQPDDTFNYSHLSLAHPTGIQGGAYFTKIQVNNKPLYIETPKCLTRQGFVKHGKKYYCDLMFDNNDQEFIHWLENLETTCQELIYKKSDTWFESKLELNDIESAFTSPMRIYKSGKYYLVRVNVKVNYTTNVPFIKVYGENEMPITIDEVTSEHSIISILEVQGIKFTSRNFQIELELKQAMVLNTEQIFEHCIIKTGISKIKESVTPFSIQSSLETDIVEEKNKKMEESREQVGSSLEDTVVMSIDTKQNISGLLHPTSGEDTIVVHNNSLVDSLENLTEVNILEMSPDLETITLKKPNQVYYEIYKAARKKAKDAKSRAIIAFLEAKNIKKTYMLENLDDSDDSDMDIDTDTDMDIDTDTDMDIPE